MGHHGLPQGDFMHCCKSWNSTPSTWGRSHAPANRIRPPGTHPPDPPDHAKVAQGPQLQACLHSCQGLGWRSLDHLLNEKDHIYTYIHILFVPCFRCIYTYIYICPNMYVPMMRTTHLFIKLYIIHIYIHIINTCIWQYVLC